MSKRRSWFGNFSIDSLLVILNQTSEELNQLKLLETETITQKMHIKELEYSLVVIKNILIRKYLESNISLQTIAKKSVKSSGMQKELFDSVFTLKIMEKEELIDIKLLEEVINNLDIEHISMIMNAKTNTIYGNYASKKYDEMIFDVEDDVLDDYVLKMKMDERRD